MEEPAAAPVDAGPPSGPDAGLVVGITVVPPSETSLDGPDHQRFRFDEDTLTCSREVPANPPYWKAIERCPRKLLPRLRGLSPTREEVDGCWWHAIEVECDPPLTDEPETGTVVAWLINVSAVEGGSRIVLGKGTDEGLRAGLRGKVIGLDNGTFTISSCRERSCEATVKASIDEIMASSKKVEIE